MKKLAAMMLAAALAAGCLAGCGSQESSGGAVPARREIPDRPRRRLEVRWLTVRMRKR